MKKKLKVGLSIFVGLLSILLIAGGLYFFKVAEIRDTKATIEDSYVQEDSPLYEDTQTFFARKKNTWTLVNKAGLKLVAWYVPAEEKTEKTVVIVHGFRSKKENMAAYAEMFHQLGYNVLVPDNRAHGESEGKYIGYGWLDKNDVEEWVTRLLKENGEQSEIALFGLSMGAATVMMASGDHLPANVKCLIEDCGYDSVWNELVYQAKDMYNLPAFPMLYEVDFLSQCIAGYSLKKASGTKQLAKNTRPTLFIHGDNDTYVPTSMVHENYAATKGERELLIVKGAAHAKSLETDKERYTTTCKAFLEKYFK